MFLVALVFMVMALLSMLVGVTLMACCDSLYSRFCHKLMIARIVFQSLSVAGLLLSVVL